VSQNAAETPAEAPGTARKNQIDQNANAVAVADSDSRKDSRRKSGGLDLRRSRQG
jgi:hypothetical protein